MGCRKQWTWAPDGGDHHQAYAREGGRSRSSLASVFFPPTPPQTIARLQTCNAIKLIRRRGYGLILERTSSLSLVDKPAQKLL